MKINKKTAIIALSSLLMATTASAEVDVSAIQATVLADVSTVAGYGFAILAAVLGASVGLKLVNKFTNKAT